jgi:hypothetical protein
MEIFSGIPSGYRIDSHNDDIVDISDEISDIKGNVITDRGEKEKALNAIRKDLGLSHVLGLRFWEIKSVQECRIDIESSLQDGVYYDAQHALNIARSWFQKSSVLWAPFREMQRRIVNTFLAGAKRVLNETRDLKSIDQARTFLLDPALLRAGGMASAPDIALVESFVQRLHEEAMTRATEEARQALAAIPNSIKLLESAKQGLIANSSYMDHRSYPYDQNRVQDLIDQLDSRIELVRSSRPYP